MGKFHSIALGTLFGAAFFAAPSHGQGEAPSTLDTGAAAALIEDLGHPHSAVRDNAEERLAALGATAAEALHAARNHADPEVAARVRYLLRSVELPWVQSDDPGKVKDLVKEYVEQGHRQDALRQLARLPADAGIEALCRIVRFESSPLRARIAAMEILLGPRAEVAAKRRAMILGALSNSHQAPAEWLRASVDGDYASAAKQFRTLAAAELQVAEMRPDDSQVFFVGLLELLAARYWLDAGFDGEVEAAVERSISLVGDDGNTLYRLATLGARMPFEISRRLYESAIALTRSDDEPAARARELSLHLYLCEQYSDILHDQGLDAGAAEMRGVVVDALEAQGESALIQSNRARKLYFEARAALARGEPENADSLLQKAVRADFTDGDVLIAIYHRSEGDAGRRQSALTLIDNACRLYKRRIEAQHDTFRVSLYCNYYAWLVANTEGDIDEAIRLSRKSLEINPNAAAYLDTLAHCYHAKGEHGAAVDTQRRAARLEPYSKMITEKLGVFEAALQASESD